MQTTIHEYVKKSVAGRKRVVGVLVGTIDEANIVRIGWSRVNISAGDRFNKERGYGLAHERTKAEEFVPAPPSLETNLLGFHERCLRYFKNQSGMFKLSFKKPQPVQEIIIVEVD